MDSLLTDAQREQLLHNGAVLAGGQLSDPYPVARIYTLDAHACWLLSELGIDGDTAYGLVDLGIGVPRLDHVRLSMLASIAGPHGNTIRSDTTFAARRRLSEYVRLAIEDGSIND